MKKLLSLLVAAGVLSAANVMAADFDLVSAAQKAQNKIDEASKKVEYSKAESAQKEADLKAKLEAKKAEMKAKKDAQDAEAAAKKAEREKAIEDTKNSLNNLKNVLSK